MPVEYPCTLLAFLAAVFCPSASSALGKLSGELLPLAALVVGTLSYATSRVILPAQVPHHNSSPVLHVLAVVPDGELLHQREYVEVVRQEVFFFFRVACGRVAGRGRRGGRRLVQVEEVEFRANFQFWNEVRPLEIGTKITIF